MNLRFFHHALIALALAGVFMPAPKADAQLGGLFGISSEEERRLGAEEHPKILKRFGGVYDNPTIGAYVAEITGRLAANSDTPQAEFRVTVLNDPVVNAFALPGGYVYVTRGLMALANNEAEFAGVMGHEIGHVTARHTAQRYSRAASAGLFSILGGLAGAALGVPALGDVFALGSELYLSSYSRDQEYEADVIGVNILGRAGYAPIAQAHFLNSLDRYSSLMNKLMGQAGRERETDLFASHPRTADRVERAIQEARSRPDNPVFRRDDYLARIEGMLFDDDPAQGYVRRRTFMHPDMKIAFTAPEGYRLVNSQEAVHVLGPDGAQVKFDIDSRNQSRQYADLRDYLRRVWGRELPLAGLENVTINGRDAATAWARVNRRNGGVQELRLVAIRGPQGIHRFLMLAGSRGLRQNDAAFQSLAESFRILSDAEAAALKPHRLRIVTVGPNDTVASLSSRLPYDDFREERFRTLNALGPNDRLEAGQKAKIVTE